MITIFCALYPEARELIRVLEMKKESGRGHFSVFSGERSRLVITGAGAVAAATAVAEASVCEPPGAADLLVNFGSCAGNAAVGSVFLCNKLTEESTGRTFYPDLLYRQPFLEAELVTAARPVTSEALACGSADTRMSPPCLYDMEAAAVYQAGSYYYAPHQMIFIKAVTDHGIPLPGGAGASCAEECGMDSPCDTRAVRREHFSRVMDRAAGELYPFFLQMMEMEASASSGVEAERQRKREADAEAEELGRRLHASAAMRTELAQLLFYWKLTGIDYQSRIGLSCPEGRTISKREGKKLLEQLKAELF